jgi:hypothetical protein
MLSPSFEHLLLLVHKRWSAFFGIWLILVPYVTAPTSFLFDSTTTIQIPNELAKHELTKHIGVDGFFAPFIGNNQPFTSIMFHQSFNLLNSLQKPKLENNLSYIYSQTQYVKSTLSLKGWVLCIYDVNV